MIILVVDGMGGGLGKSVIELLKSCKLKKGSEIIAVGTNSVATANMMKAGPDGGATGENAISFNASRADYIIASAGMIIGNSMQGEVTPTIASAISCSDAHKILIPIGKYDAVFLGTNKSTLSEVLNQIKSIIERA